MNTLANLFAYYNNGETDIYHFALGRILENTHLFLNSSIYEIADYCSASTATISRLSQKLGYKNFSDFKHNLFDAIHYYRFNNHVMPSENKAGNACGWYSDYFNSMEDMIGRVKASVTQEKIQQVSELLYQSKRVRIFSFNTGFTDTALQINLLMTGKESLRCDRFADQIEEAKRLEPGDVVLILAPDNTDALDVIPLAQIIEERGAQSILLTNSIHCIHENRVNCILTFEGTETNLDLWGMYMIVDLINMYYREQYVQEL